MLAQGLSLNNAILGLHDNNNNNNSNTSSANSTCPSKTNDKIDHEPKKSTVSEDKLLQNSISDDAISTTTNDNNQNDEQTENKNDNNDDTMNDEENHNISSSNQKRQSPTINNNLEELQKVLNVCQSNTDILAAAVAYATQQAAAAATVQQQQQSKSSNPSSLQPEQFFANSFQQLIPNLFNAGSASNSNNQLAQLQNFLNLQQAINNNFQKLNNNNQQEETTSNETTSTKSVKSPNKLNKSSYHKTLNNSLTISNSNSTGNSKQKLKSNLIKKQINESSSSDSNKKLINHSSSTSSISTSTSPSLSSGSSSNSSTPTTSPSPSSSPNPQQQQNMMNKKENDETEEIIIDSDNNTNKNNSNDSLLDNYSKLLSLSRALNNPKQQQQTPFMQNSFNNQFIPSQSLSVPKLNNMFSQNISNNNLTSKNNDHQITTNKIVYFPSPTTNNSGSNGAVSSEVKLKLKNAILSKLDRNRNNTISNNNTNHNNNLTSISMYQLPSTNSQVNKQTPMLQSPTQQMAQLTDLSNNNMNFNFVGQVNSKNKKTLSINNHQTIADKNNNFMNSDVQIKNNLLLNTQNLEHLDENNLRRTTSEPNLKVKSALKDRLLEKRNLIKPFPSNNNNNSNKKQDHKASHINKPIPLLPAPIPQPQLTLIKPNYNMSTPLSSSLSSLPSFQNHHNQQNAHTTQNDNNENLIAAAAAAATAAALAAVNKNNNNKHQSLAYNQIKQTLQQFALQQKDSNINNNNKNIEFFESLALAAALVSNQQQINDNNKRIKTFDNTSQAANLLNPYLFQPMMPPLPPQLIHTQQQQIPFSSVSFPNLPNSSHYFNNSSRPQNHHYQHHPHLVGNNKEENKKQISSSFKFGHIVDVEEENEAMLENELKNAAKINEIATKNLLYNNNNNSQSINVTPTSTPPTDINNNNNNSKIAIDEDDNDISELMRHKRYKSNNYDCNNNIRLERASSHQLYSSNLLPSFNSKTYHNNPSIPRFNNNNIPANQFSLNLNEAQQQLLYLQQQELEEKRKYNSTNSKLSFLSDPHLLRSLKIASMANLNQQTENLTKKNENTTNNNNNGNNKITPMECNSNMNDQQQDQRKYRYTTGIAYDKIMLKHECTCNNPANHLETPDRIKSIWSRFKSKDLDEECEIINSKLANINDLFLCHSEQYSLIYGSDLEMRPQLPKEYLQMYMMSVCMSSCNGFALTEDQDNSWNEEYTPLACRSAIGTTYELASLVYAGKLKNGFALVRPPGSHAEFNKPLGFCYFNTVAIVAKMLKKNLGLERILIVDWDVHHGNGTQQMLYNDSNICYVSLHRHDNGNFFPGTGSIYECGHDAGLGKNINIAWNSRLNPPMGDTEYLAAFRSVVMPIAKSFKPQIVLVSCGFDGSENHPKELGGYKLSPMCFAYMTKKLMSLAEGKVVLALEGGYDIQSLCDCSEMCINALMNKQIPSFPTQTLDSIPNSQAVQDLENVIDVQKKYWPNLKDYKQYIKMSQNQFISVYVE